MVQQAVEAIAYAACFLIIAASATALRLCCLFRAIRLCVFCRHQQRLICGCFFAFKGKIVYRTFLFLTKVIILALKN